MHLSAEPSEKAPRPARQGFAIASLLAASLALTACGSEGTAAPQSSALTEVPASLGASPTTAPTQAGLPVVPTASDGCTTPDASLFPGTTVTRTLPGDSAGRDYLLHVPPTYDPTAPAPVVLSMHGMGTNAVVQLANSGILASADEHGYVVVAPNAADGQWQLPAPESGDSDSPDVAFISDVMADASSALCTDPSRQYASGMSMGSAMALVLACQPERMFAAFGGVGASFYDAACNGAPPAPLIYFHGTDDDVVPFEGGTARGFAVEPVDEVMADWAEHNGCPAPPAATVTDDVTLFQWAPCERDAVVDFYRVSDGGHTWPGSPVTTNPALADFVGVTTTTVSATEAMWEFFSRYSLPTAP